MSDSGHQRCTTVSLAYNAHRCRKGQENQAVMTQMASATDRQTDRSVTAVREMRDDTSSRSVSS